MRTKNLTVFFAWILILCLTLSACGGNSQSSLSPDDATAKVTETPNSPAPSPVVTGSAAAEPAPAEIVEKEPEPEVSPYAWLGFQDMPECNYLDALCSNHYIEKYDLYTADAADGVLVTQIIDGVNSVYSSNSTTVYAIDEYTLSIYENSKLYYESTRDRESLEELSAQMQEAMETGDSTFSYYVFQGTGNGTVPLLPDEYANKEYEYYEYYRDASTDDSAYSQVSRYYMKDGDVFAVYSHALIGAAAVENTMLIKEMSGNIPEDSFTLPDLTGYEKYEVAQSDSASDTETDNDSTGIALDTDLAEEGGTVTDESGISVDFTPGIPIPDNAYLAIVIDEPVTDEDLGAVYTTVDISLGNTHELGGYVDIRIPYDDRPVEDGQDPAKCVTGMYFNEETEEWESVLYDVDTASKELIIHTDHFSKYGCFVFKNEGKRMAQITKIDDWMAEFSDDDILAAVQELIDNEGVPGEACRQLTKPVLEESFNALAAATGATADKATVIGNLTTLFISGSGLADVIGNSEWANAFTTALGYAGTAVSIVSLAGNALKSDKTDNDILSMYKDAVYLLGSLSQSVTLGTIGASIWLVDKGLTDMGNYAYNKIAEDTTKAYRQYYSKYMTRTKAEWRWTLKDIAMEAIKDRSAADTAVMKEIDRWCNLFWSIDTNTYTHILIDVGQMGRGWPDAATREAITADYKRDLIRLLEPVFEEVQQDLQWKLEDEQEKAFNKIKKMLNTTLTFEITEELRENQEEGRYSNYTAQFSPLNAISDKADWTVSLSSSGTTTVKTTLIGYLIAGKPTEIQLYAPGKTPGKDKPEKTISFTYTAPKSIIQLNGDDISGKYDLIITIPNAEPSEFEADLSLLSDGSMTVAFPVTMADTESVFGDGPITYSTGTCRFKGKYDDETQMFTGTITCDLSDLLYNDCPFIITFDTASEPVSAAGDINIHREVLGYTYDATAQISMTKMD